MAMSKGMKLLLRLLSKPDIQVKKNYKFDRKVVNAAHYHRLRPFYDIMDIQLSGKDGDIPLRFFFPDDIDGRYPILLFFHGGGWVLGSIDSYNRTCANLAKYTKHQVISVDYSLAPEYPFPRAVEECYNAARVVFANAGLLGAEASQITLIGDSAGGNLAAAVSLMARDRGEFMPQRQILIYPATNNDHSANSPFASIVENGTDYILTSKRVQDYLELYAGGKAENYANPYFAPLISEDLSHQPRTLIITAQYDPLRDEGEAYGHKLAAFGNTVKMHRIEDAIHGFFTLPMHHSAVKECYFYINQFLGAEEMPNHNEVGENYDQKK